MTMVFEIAGKEHVLEEDSDEIQCDCKGSKCPQCGSYVHVQTTGSQDICVCEKCHFETHIKPTLADK